MEPSTKTQILDVAEQLFAEAGFDATSLRAVTSAAGVNLAAVNYHFGSKEGLVHAVFARRLEPLNRERLDRLDRILRDATADGRQPSLEDLLRAVFEPALRMAREPGGTNFLRLMGRMHADPDAMKSAGPVLELFAEMRGRFLPVFAGILPSLPPEDLFWRLHFVFGAMASTMTCRSTLEWLSQGLCRTDDVEANVVRLVTFAAAGLRAAPSPVPGAEEIDA